MDYLTAEQVNERLTMDETIRSIEQFYLDDSNGDMIMPDRMHIEDGDNTSLLMPSYYGDYYATKLVGVAPNNTSLGKPTIHGLMILYSRKTMEPLLMCDAMPITGLRTGALGGLGMKYLAKEEASSLGIIGTGTQGWSHLQSACAVRSIQTVKVYNRSQNKLSTFIKHAREAFPALHIEQASPEELVRDSDIIVTTTTSEKPVLPELDPAAYKGKQIVGVGSFHPAMQEIPDSILKEADEVYVDAPSAFRESGDMIRAQELGVDPEQTLSLKEIIERNHRPQNPEGQSIIFKSVGAAIFDLVVTKALYEKIR
ncbi:delta(1)-pyrroline-2-carboxylate reductase [Halobacillus andaensis]|uniref:Delta(1)-pyrroline-2-carboxylate reductase n=1 Tax=Halobacillus andaensis TaxID=1176239 RepID=A0A917B327_HALAA|nr:ornithine cyclodeaminase family protein [Halobacillus andaensis]MBP2004848.1 ornithine cyclodeaminase [Halobacillus andaensis]GGF18442.1 delta(1)-pyrroline-2-carboxylate reductase [Halobacillus andaensis]